MLDPQYDGKMGKQITELENRIKLALRLNRHGLVGHISSALNGESLQDVIMFPGCNLLEYLDKCDEEE